MTPDDCWIALDGNNEPTVWTLGDHPDRPVALFRRCDIGDRGWALIETVLNDATETCEQACFTTGVCDHRLPPPRKYALDLITERFAG